MSSETPQPEYLDREPAPPARSGRRWGLVAGATVGVLAVAGAGAWGVSSLVGGGAGAEAAAPADTLAFLSVDLDPGAGQKVEAYQTLKKFPALAERLGGEENLRRSLVEAFLTDAPCDDLTWKDDFEPWLGERLGIGVRPGGDVPVPFAVVQVSDQGGATEAVEAIAACGDEDPELPGVAFVDDYMVVAEDDATAEAVASATEEGSLADDDRFSTWVDEAGGGGIVTGYLAAEGPGLFLDELAADMGLDPTGDLGGDPDLDTAPGAMEPDLDQLRETFEEFEGGAVVARFDDEALEVEAAMSAVGELDPSAASDSGLAELPASTVVALGLGIGDSAVEDMLSSMAGSMGQEAVDELVAQVEAETGLTPEKLQTLLGDGVSVALDSSVELGTLVSLESGTDVPAGIRIDGDPDEILPVLEELVAAADAEGLLHVERGDGAVAVGFDEEYLTQLVANGDLGEQDRFTSALPDLDDSAGGLFVDFDEDDWLAPVLRAGGDQELEDNLEPLDSLGATGEHDDDVLRGVLRLSTD